MSYENENKDPQPQIIINHRPQFDFTKYPIGSHAKTYSGKVVRMIKVESDDSIGWAFGRQGKRLAIATDKTGLCMGADNGEKLVVNRDNSIDPQTVKFSRMKTTDIDMRGIPLGTVFMINERWQDVGYVKVLSTNDTKETDQPIKCMPLIYKEEVWEHKGEEDSSCKSYTKEGYAYGGSYKSQRNQGDLYYERLIYPMSQEDLDFNNAHLTAKQERRAKARSIFGGEYRGKTCQT